MKNDTSELLKLERNESIERPSDQHHAVAMRTSSRQQCRNGLVQGDELAFPVYGESYKVGVRNLLVPHESFGEGFDSIHETDVILPE